jgi:hypothetical protein
LLEHQERVFDGVERPLMGHERPEQRGAFAEQVERERCFVVAAADRVERHLLAAEFMEVDYLAWAPEGMPATTTRPPRATARQQAGKSSRRG